MISNEDISCLCCKKKINFIAVEPEFYCKICVRKKKFHNCTKIFLPVISPVKWYHKLDHSNVEVQNQIKCCLREIKIIVDNDKVRHKKIVIEKINGIKIFINNLKKIHVAKLKIRNSILTKRREIDRKFGANFDCQKDITHCQDLSETLLDKTKKIQRYLNDIQCLFATEIFQILPIKFSKYEHSSISNFHISISLSNSLTLEPNDETSSAIFLLTILSTSITFILDLHLSSMNSRDFAVATLCRLQQPLKRDEIMSVYDMLVKMVHHIMQATLGRTSLVEPPYVNLFDYGSLQNDPLKNLVLLNMNLKKALVMDGLSNPYVLQLTDMFLNARLDDFCNCARADHVNGLTATTNSLDFVEISSNMPLCDSVTDYNYTNASTDWFRWVQKSLRR